MGRYLLFIVLATVVGGAILALNMRGTLSETLRRHNEGQADVLAREIAEAGQSVALSEMAAGGSFRDPTVRLGTEQDYEGGRFRIEYVPGATDQEATLRVTGTYGGAVHTVESAYAYEPLDAPGPLWLDVPYATMTASNGGRIADAQGDRDVQFDRRKHDALELEGLLPLDNLTNDLGAAVQGAKSRMSIPETDAWAGRGKLLDGLNVDDAEGLYQKAVGAIDPAAGDRTFAGDWTVGGPGTVAGLPASLPVARVPLLAAPLAAAMATDASGGTMANATFGSAADGTQITFFDGDLTVAGSLAGHGVLLVDGALRVEPDARLTWNGIVIVHGTDATLPVELDGAVTVTGMLVVVHEAFPPGGHLDVTVYRAQAGMTSSAPQGNRSEQARPWTKAYPFHQHTHAFDITPASAPRGDHVYFMENGGAGKHEFQTQFRTYLQRFGAEPVYLSFANADNDGYARVVVDVAGTEGTGGPLRTTVQGGFGDFAADVGGRRSRTFPANALRAFDLDVLSLRGLKQAFDNASCSSWPLCISRDWNREGALAFRVHRASDHARLYEATFYWHMREDEQALHEKEEAAWRDKIRGGEAFGAHLRLGRNVRLTFDIGEVAELTERLDFDGGRVVLVSSTSSHVTAAETRADEADATASNPDPDGNGLVTVCHKPGKQNKQTKTLHLLDLPDHLGHGDTVGACGGSGASGGSGRSGRGGGSGASGDSGSSGESGRSAGRGQATRR
ncbi:hypothetical protein [Rubrivirga sp.]|uniref:hypothetical protein n=1 Tax=Rubrivirga sp. TaxID=1885344 RepID=UPI003B52D776